MPFPTNSDGSIRPFNADELRLMKLETADVKDGSNPTLKLDSQGCSVNGAWFCDWNQVDNAIAALLGGVSLAGSAPNFRLSRVPPLTFPRPGYEQYLAMALESVTGAKSAGRNDYLGIPAYKAAKLTIRYEQVFFTAAVDGVVPEQNRYVEQLPSTVETRYLSLPGSSFNYQTGDGLPIALAPKDVLIPYGIGKVEPMRKVAYKWHRVPYEVWFPGAPLFDRVHGNRATNSLPFLGTVNKTPCLGYPAGFVLFDGVDEEIVPDPVRGFPCWNLTYRFSVNAKVCQYGAGTGQGGWNYFWWQGAGAGVFTVPSGYFLGIKGDSWISNGFINDGMCLYSERDHNLLWSVAG